MGFEESDVLDALRVCNNNESAAVSRCILTRQYLLAIIIILYNQWREILDHKMDKLRDSFNIISTCTIQFSLPTHNFTHQSCVYNDVLFYKTCTSHGNIHHLSNMRVLVLMLMVHTCSCNRHGFGLLSIHV